MSFNNKRNEGFTIIEVLIVLAIAGLILLVVFLAVPALQRNSRNTAAKNEAASILGAVSEFSSNNNGATVASTDAADILKLANTKNVSTLTVEAQAASQSAPDANKATLALKAKCAKPSATTLANLTTGGTNRQYALVYAIENSAGTLYACQEG